MMTKTCQICSSKYQKGKNISLRKFATSKYCSLNCYGKWKSNNRIGKNHPSWVGNSITYKGLHNWLINKFGKATKCEISNCKNISKKFDWALKKNRLYVRNIKNFLQLCRSCHKRYDFNENNIKRNKKGTFIKK